MDSKRSLLTDRDAIQDMVARRGPASTVRLVGQVAVANGRHYQVIGADVLHARAWERTREVLDTAAGDISQEMRRAIHGISS